MLNIHINMLISIYIIYIYIYIYVIYYKYNEKLINKLKIKLTNFIVVYELK